jgi:hypothetical protein
MIMLVKTSSNLPAAPYHEGTSGDEGKAPRIFTHSTKWMLVVSFTFWLLYLCDAHSRLGVYTYPEEVTFRTNMHQDAIRDKVFMSFEAVTLA